MSRAVVRLFEGPQLHVQSPSSGQGGVYDSTLQLLGQPLVSSQSRPLLGSA